MNSITREYWFSAAHVIEGHPKCGRLHGHNYKVVVEVRGPILYETGMILDFATLDSYVKPVIDLYDHRFIVSAANIAAENPIVDACRAEEMIRPGIDHSTAEIIAENILECLREKTRKLDLIVWSVTVWETVRSYAKAS